MGVYSFNYNTDAHSYTATKTKIWPIGRCKMEVAKSLEPKFRVDLTERELFLVKWSLDLMLRNDVSEHLHNEIQTLRSKLSMRSIRKKIETN